MTKQVINIGNAANDGTGTPLRDAMDMANDNFTELYNAKIFGPCNGTKYEAMRMAIRYVMLWPLVNQSMYYISRILCGQLGGGNYTYTFAISRTTNFTGETEVCSEYTVTVGAAKTGLQKIPLPAHGTSTTMGFMVVDFDKLTLGTDYTCAKFDEGALFGIAGSNVPSASGGGGSPNPITIATAGETIDGSKEQYIYDMTGASETVLIDTMANIVGILKIKNSGNNAFSIHSAEDYLIDGYSTIVLSKNQSLEIIPNVNKFHAFGVYDIPI